MDEWMKSGDETIPEDRSRQNGGGASSSLASPPKPETERAPLPLKDDESDGFLDEIDAAFDNILLDHQGGDGGMLLEDYSQEIQEASRAEVHALFESILLQYLEVIKDCIQSIFKGENTRVVIRSFEGTLEPLLEASSSIEHGEMHRVFVDFQNHLEAVKAVDHKLTFREIRPFAKSFDELLDLLQPEIREKYFADAKYRRNQNQLLEAIRTIKFIGPIRLQRLYAAGLTSTDIIEKSTPKEIAQATGIAEDLSEKIRTIAHRFKRKKEQERMEKMLGLCSELSEMLQDIPHERVLRILRGTAPGLKSLERQLVVTNAYINKVLGMYPKKSDPEIVRETRDEEENTEV